MSVSLSHLLLQIRNALRTRTALFIHWFTHPFIHPLPGSLNCYSEPGQNPFPESCPVLFPKTPYLTWSHSPTASLCVCLSVSLSFFLSTSLLPKERPHEDITRKKILPKKLPAFKLPFIRTLRNKIFVVLGHPVYSMCYSSRS